MKTFIRLLINALIVGMVMAPLAARAEHGAHIVISEIQISGATTTDEFVELYNPTATPVIVTHYKLQKRTASGTASNLLTDFPETVIAPHGFLLVAHPTGYTGAIAPDLRYSTTNSIAKDNTIVLFNETGIVIDLVGMGAATEFETAPAPNPEGNQSIERADGVDTESNAADFFVRNVGTPESIASPARPPLVPPEEEPTEPPSDPTDEPPSEEPPSEEPPSEEPPAEEPPSEEPPTEEPPTEEPPAENPPAPEPPRETPTEPAPSPSYPAPGPNDLVINELVSNPSGEDEWIEIKNVSSETLTLGGSSIRDGSGRSIALTGEIAPTAYRVFSFAAPTLNNSGDLVELRAAGESVLDRVAYGDWEAGTTVEAPPKGAAIARIPDGIGAFMVTRTPTKENENVLTEPPQPPPLETVPPNAPPTTTPGTPNPPPATPRPSLPPGTLLISELYPYPYVGEIEWIEITNPGDATILIDGWTIADERGTKTPLTGSLGSHSYFLVESPRGHLNNDGDTATLFDPAGGIIDTVTYGEDAARGEAYARVEGNWFWTVHPTPRETNVVVLGETESVVGMVLGAVEENESNTKTQKKTKTVGVKKSETIYDVPLEDARELPVGTLVRTVGTVSVAPGIFTARTFYVAGSGMQVYLHSIDVPQLTPGDVVELRGKLGSSGGETRIVISKPEGLSVLRHDAAPKPEPIEIGMIDNATEGWLVTVEGTITDKANDTLTLMNAGESVSVVIKNGAGIDGRTIRVGETVRITGIVSETKSGFRLLPRGPEDVAVIGAAARGTETKPRSRMPWLTMIAGASTATMLALILRKQWTARRLRTLPEEPIIL